MTNLTEKKRSKNNRDKVLARANKKLPSFPRQIAGLEEASIQWDFKKAAHLLRRATIGPTLEEINSSLEILYSSGAEEIALLACTLSYPTKTDDANYRKITKLINEFPKNIIGISDHVEPEEHMISGPICLSLGAKIFEKHFTLDRTMGGGS